MKKQLRGDAKTDPKTGTTVSDLVKAMNKMINEGKKGAAGKHKGQLEAKGTIKRADLQNFAYLDDEYGKGEDVIILFSWREGTKTNNHFVTVRKITGTGATRKITFMDPETGKIDMMMVTLQNGRLETSYQGTFPGKIEGIVSLSPVVTVDSSSADVPGGNADSD